MKTLNKNSPVSVPNHITEEKSAKLKTTPGNKKRFWSRFFQSPELVVTEVTDGLFRFVKMSERDRKYAIDFFGAVHARDLSVDPSDPIETHKAGIRWLQKNQAVNSFNVIVVPSRLDFFVRRLELPRMKSNELFKAVAWEVDKLIPIPVDQSYLILKEDRTITVGCSIAAGVVPRDQIDPWESLGNNLNGIVPTSVAFASLGPKVKTSDLAYCYIYYNGTVLNIGFYNSSGLQYSHPIQFKGDSLFNTNESGLGIKRAVEELIGSIEVFYSYFPDITIDGLVLMVSPDKAEHLRQSILERINIEILSSDTSIRSHFNNPDILESLDIDFLPLLGAVVADKMEFKFLPRSLAYARELKKLGKIRKYFLIATVLLAILFAGFWHKKTEDLRSELIRRESVRNSIMNSTAYRQLADYKSVTDYLVKLREDFEFGENDYSAILKILSAFTPKGVHLESLTTSDYNGSIKTHINGYYDGDLAGADIAIMNFMESLNERAFGKLKLQRLGTKISGTRKIESFVLDGIWKTDENR